MCLGPQGCGEMFTEHIPLINRNVTLEEQLNRTVKCEKLRLLRHPLLSETVSRYISRTDGLPRSVFVLMLNENYKIKSVHGHCCRARKEKKK